MSRLTASPFQKLSPFEFPRAPLSPPETMSDHLGSAHPSVLGPMPVEPHHAEHEATHSYQPTETPGARFRKVSSLAYHSSGLRESRERAVQRSSKFFVVVVPPPVLLQEHGQLGHTLSLGPRHRLSQGILMPLFPTMYGQLATIAKEFNFPSTTGICLYFHFTENGITVTPRISDDSWPVIWSNVLDPSAAPPRVPIVGKLEFDIDLRHARWYSAWIASAHRENLDVPASVGPSAAPSLAHFRGDSRTTDLEINLQDDPLDSESVSPPSVRFNNRHVPRKLSLVDRLDSSLRSVAKNAAQDASPEQSASVRALSPIFQEDEPKTAKLSDSLEKRVKSWRASASLTPGALAVKGQTSLEPANLPNTMPLDDVADEGVDELNLEDFTWSISSLGPNDWEEGSVASGGRLPSVHLEHRMALSVAMTPSDCTSFGPSDYTLPSPVPTMERVLTPDIAHRMYEDCPLTPDTATSWGPPSEYPASLISFNRAPSVGLVDRLVFSSPPTPMSATSWGPPSEYPPSPLSFGRPPSVHLGDRMSFGPPMTPEAGRSAFHFDDVPFTNLPWGHAWPYLQQMSDSEPWGYVWPYIQQSLVSSSLWRYSWPYFHPASAKSAPWAHVWPYDQPVSISPVVNTTWPARSRSSLVAKPWGHSWPYSSSRNYHSAVWRHSWPYGSYTDKTISVHLPCVYPSLKIYPDVFPHFDLYPAEPREADQFLYPQFDLYPALSRKHMLLSGIVEIEIGSAYPDFDIYPARFTISLGSCGYPDFNIYPPLQIQSLPAAQVLKMVWNYPVFDLYPGVYPHIMPYPSKPSSPVVSTAGYPNFNIYPATQRQISKEVVVQVSSAYPDFDIYPRQFKSKPESCGYPDFNIYPSLQSQSLPAVRVLQIAWCYPVFDLYPGVYPHVTPYPSKSSSLVHFTASYPNFEIYPTRPRQISKKEVVVQVSSEYPDFEIYPRQLKFEAKSCGYPHFNLYPSMLRTSIRLSDVQVMKMAWSYPIFDLYPGVYPSIDPYPTQSLPAVSASAATGYPILDIYPEDEVEDRLRCHIHTSAYPYFDIYPVKHLRSPRPEPIVDVSSGKPTWSYAIFDLYPAVYPHVTPYPSQTFSGAPNTGYPDFDIYPIASRQGPQSNRPVNVLVKGASAYPHFEIYPLRTNFSSDLAKRPNVELIRVTWNYPIFDLYPAVYPYTTPYPSATSDFVESVPSRSSEYPDFIIYPCRQYPHFDLYHSLVVEKASIFESQFRYPVFDTYPAIYPHVVPYPALVLVSVTTAKIIDKPLTATSKNYVAPTRTLLKTPVSMIRQKKSHSVLHNEVFPDGIVSTPSGTVNLRRELRTSIRPEVPPRPAGGRARSGSVSQRPLSSITPTAVVGLPPRPNFRLSTYKDPQPTPGPVYHRGSEATSTSSSASLPLRSASLRAGPAGIARASSDVSPLRRAASSATPSSTKASSFRDVSSLAPLPEVNPLASFGIQKPVLPTHVVDDRRPLVRKRESVVSQRIRAFEETGSDPRLSRLFPLPPPPPPPTGGLPPLPS
ncbi:hypothetical protein D9757_004912 [Collybiopsis confluens]|uniref:Uncharacterized protein n=1 Tax=Collybiopsis confluens TaxID=2823264 RepID=A0A8H5MCY9_9AGAR|nr:hypothetical protein D9757_004912 [Collybiopsis confluens]